MAQTSRAQAIALINKFEALWKQKHGRKYNGNRHADHWGFRDMVEDVGYMRAEKIVEYYFHLSSPDHSRQWLIYNYDKVAQKFDDMVADKKHRQKLLEDTKKMMEEYSGESRS